MLLIYGNDPLRPAVTVGVGAQHLLEDPHTVIQGDRVLHLRYRVRR